MKYSLNIESSAKNFISELQAKQFKQVMTKILSLLSDPIPQDSRKLEGVSEGRRVDQGEYRILYFIKHSKPGIEGEIQIWKIGKRNDSEVYRHL